MSTKSDPPRPSGRVLCVDDEANILKALKRLFIDEEIEILTAPSGPEGLALLKQHDDIGVILSDQRMPVMTGVDFLEQSRPISPLAVRILLTGYADITAAVDAINRGGAARYLTKPWQDEELVQTVKSALQQYGLLKENKRLVGVIAKQNEELKHWNSELELMVQAQTEELQKSNDSLKKLNSRLRSNFTNTIFAFSGLLELRNRTMRNHSQNVAEIAGKVAQVLQLPAAEKETLVVAALLHDIGKIGISDLMLTIPPDEMNSEERQAYEQHAIRGQAALDAIDDLRKAGVIIRHHHERYNGSGFPDRLRKEEIPLSSRIIAIADYADQLVRQAKDAGGLEMAFKQLRAEKGTRFDPQLLPLVEEQARLFYKANLPKGEQVALELHPRDLSEGMVLSQDVISGTGILQLRKGTRLDKTNIAVLQRLYALDPSKHGIFVLTKEGKP